MAVNEIGAGSLQSITPGKLNQDNKSIPKSESSRDFGIREDENFKVEISFEAVELARVAREKEGERRIEDQQDKVVEDKAKVAGDQVLQQKNEKQAEVAEMVRPQTVDLIV